MQSAPEIRDALVSLFAAMKRGDNEAITKMLSSHDGVLVIGTAPGEWWTGIATFAPVFEQHLKEAGGGFDVTPGNPVGFRSGDVGWAADRPRLALPDGSTLPLRFTVVFELEAGAWKIVQWHGSLDVGNEESFGREFTA